MDLSFASVNWVRAVRDRAHPGMLVNGISYLAEEMRTADIAVAGKSEFRDWPAHLLAYAECRPPIPDFGSEAGLLASAGGLTAALKERHAQPRPAWTPATPTCSSTRTECRCSSRCAGWAPRRRPRSWPRRSGGGCPSAR